MPPFRSKWGLPTWHPSGGSFPSGLEVTMVRETRYRSNPDMIDMIGIGMVLLTLALWLSFIFI
ncbi:hypothetical protein AA11826_1816 [Komagataeibacter oboediens DSM 11826]|uniref:Uncharacterized protein n=1 Tax=Komagataeibacter oboediens TaxID=65958 RepID=A0A318QW58_9PROT|nr:hypothetical protein [Komagataeibacter oboediens]PYD81748.1 hypothetical protein CFR80_10000 [Komagataeibacter oboediens]GBR38394.1 hypothetical protein AA11826_1816 [Komagataeibacter oboediens DSM 11826]